MPEAKARLRLLGARFSGKARGVSDRTVLILGLAAIIGFCITATVITLIIKLL